MWPTNLRDSGACAQISVGDKAIPSLGRAWFEPGLSLVSLVQAESSAVGAWVERASILDSARFKLGLDGGRFSAWVEPTYVRTYVAGAEGHIEILGAMMAPS